MVLVGKPKLDNLENLGTDRITFKQTSKKYDERMWTGLIRLGIGTCVGLL